MVGIYKPSFASSGYTKLRFYKDQFNLQNTQFSAVEVLATYIKKLPQCIIRKADLGRKMRNVFLVSLSIRAALFTDLPSMASLSFYYCVLGFE